MIDIFLNILAFVALFVGSYTDLKKREVPDWVSYSLIFAALGIRLIYSVFTADLTIFLFGIIGFAVFFVLANIMYFLRQWGGGDAKILMGIGAILGLNLFDAASYVITASFILLWVFAGAIYGVAWSIYLAIKNKTRFAKAFKEIKYEFRYLFNFSLVFLIVGIITLFINFYSGFLLFGISFIFFIGIISFLFVNAVEQSCLLRYVKSSQLTEGDWIAETIRMNGRIFIDEKNPGITKEQILKLKKYKNKILVKVGIPFIPVFLLAFAALLVLKNFILSLI